MLLYTLSITASPQVKSFIGCRRTPLIKQGSMNSGEFHSHVTKIAKRCQFLNAQAEERAIRGCNISRFEQSKSQGKTINLMNEEGKVLTVEFLMYQLETEDYNPHHKSLSQLNSTISVNFASWDNRQNKQGKSKKNAHSGKQLRQNKSGVLGSSNSGHHSRKLPGRGSP